MKDDVIKINQPVKIVAKQMHPEPLQADASVNEEDAILRNTIGELKEPNGEEEKQD